MVEKRKEYRKNFNSSGQIYLGGETLDFISYDVSVAGLCIEIIPGSLLTELKDFETILEENNSAEIYVRDLMLTGKVQVIWARLDKGKVRLGLEFKDVKHNAEKFLRTRSNYRKTMAFSGYLVVNDKRTDFEGLNISVDGMAIHLPLENFEIKPGDIVKLLVNEPDIKGIGKIIWINSIDEQFSTVGLRYLTLD